MINICPRKFRRCMIRGGFVVALCSTAVLAADSITGVVRNKTSGQPAAGNEVLLFRLIEPNSIQPSLPAMQEEARTHTDAQGSFTLDVRYPNQSHVVRIVHQGVNYEQRLSTSETVSIDVFDAVSKLQGLAGSIEIIRIGAQGDHLHVSDMIEIRNDSRPPLTQAGAATFETYLPAHAKLDSVLASGPGKIASLISAMPVSAKPGLYRVSFPLQPGATKFAFNYDVPYVGYATFHTRNMYPLQQFAVMIPSTMKFTSHSAAFQILRTGNDRYQVEAANLVRAGEGPEFEISGIGPLPALRVQSQSPPHPPVSMQSLPAPVPVPVPLTAVDSQSQTPPTNGSDAAASRILAQRSPTLSQEKWWVMFIGIVMLGACAALFWRGQRLSLDERLKAMHVSAVQTSDQPVNRAASMLEALTGELRQLEIDRSVGTITGEEYASARQALEGTVKRALARAGAH